MRSQVPSQLQIRVDPDANHRALRRCHGCGSYTRPFDEVDGTIRCERCAQKARREREDSDEDLNRRPASIVL